MDPCLTVCPSVACAGSGGSAAPEESHAGLPVRAPHAVGQPETKGHVPRSARAPVPPGAGTALAACQPQVRHRMGGLVSHR